MYISSSCRECFVRGAVFQGRNAAGPGQGARSLERRAQSYQASTSSLPLDRFPDAVAVGKCRAWAGGNGFPNRRQASKSRRVRFSPPGQSGAQRLQAHSSTPEDVNRVASAIHQAFLSACLPNSGVPYVAALRAFIAATVRAYRLGYSLDALEIELRRVSAESARSGSRSMGGELPRSLEADEVELRTIWLTLVFKVLRYVNFPRDRLPPEAPTESSSRSRAITEEFRVPDQFDRFVQSIVDAARSGYDLARIRLEQQLQIRSMTSLQGNTVGAATNQRSPLEAAILNQSTRLVLLTVEIVDTWQRNGGIEPSV